MSSTFTTFIQSQFSAPVASPHLNLIQHLKAVHPQSQHVSVLYTMPQPPFPLSGYLDAIGIEPAVVEAETRSTFYYDQDTSTIYAKAVVGVTDFMHDSTSFRAYKASWTQEFGRALEFYHLVFDGLDDSAGKKLIEAVYAWGQELKEEIWVFEGGQWGKNKQLYKAVQSANWDDVVLGDEFKDGLRRDTKTFFESKEAYVSLNITWKRGILLLGPPGNGKTESIKALLNETKGAAPLYVKSFVTCRVCLSKALMGAHL